MGCEERASGVVEEDAGTLHRNCDPEWSREA